MEFKLTPISSLSTFAQLNRSRLKSIKSLSELAVEWIAHGGNSQAEKHALRTHSVSHTHRKFVRKIQFKFFYVYREKAGGTFASI